VAKAAEAFNNRSGSGKLVPFEMDVTNKDSIRQAVSRLVKEQGKLDILVNNAGQVGPMSRFLGNRKSSENTTAQSMGTALFEAESFEDWANHYTVMFFPSSLLPWHFWGSWIKLQRIDLCTGPRF